jgi:hypothetical protein
VFVQVFRTSCVSVIHSDFAKGNLDSSPPTHVSVSIPVTWEFAIDLFLSALDAAHADFGGVWEGLMEQFPVGDEDYEKPVGIDFIDSKARKGLWDRYKQQFPSPGSSQARRTWQAGFEVFISDALSKQDPRLHRKAPKPGGWSTPDNKWRMVACYLLQVAR